MLNRIWHETHRMPERATLNQRVDWHIEHAEHCGCRDIPASIRAEMARRGLIMPERADRLPPDA